MASVLSFCFSPWAAVFLSLASFESNPFIYVYYFLFKLAVDTLVLNLYYSASIYQQVISSQFFLSCLLSLGPLCKLRTSLAFFSSFSQISTRLLATVYSSYLRTTKHFLPKSIFFWSLQISSSQFCEPFFIQSFFFLRSYFNSCDLFQICYNAFLWDQALGLVLGLAGSSGIYVRQVTLSSSKMNSNFLVTLFFSSYLGLFCLRSSYWVAIKDTKYQYEQKSLKLTYQQLNILLLTQQSKIYNQSPVERKIHIKQADMRLNQTRSNNYIQQPISAGPPIYHSFAGYKWKGSQIIVSITIINILAVLIISAIAIASVGSAKQAQIDNTASLQKQIQAYTEEHQITAVFLAASYSDQLALQSIKSFMPSQTNKLISRIIVGLAPYMIILSDYLADQNVTVIECPQYPYEVSCLDKIVGLVNTEFYFFTTTDWRQDGYYFMSYSASILQKDAKVSQVLPYNVRSSPQPMGFSLAPGLHRLSDYKKLQSYSKLASPTAIINYNFEQIVSKWFISQGYKTTITNKLDMKTIQVEYYFPLYTNEKPKKPAPSKPKIEPPPKAQPLSYFVKHAQSALKQSPKIHEIQLLKGQYTQLPFCILIFWSDKSNLDKIEQSISAQNYSKVKIISIEKQSKSSENNYYAYSKKIKNQCAKNAIVMFIQKPIKPSSLQYLNNIHQQHLCWVTYSRNDKQLQVHSFYSRVYQLLEKNDFNNNSRKYLQANDISIQTIGPLELFPDSTKRIDHSKLYQSSDHSYLHIFKTISTHYSRTPYNKINRLNHDMPVDIAYFDQRKQGIFMGIPPAQSNLTVKNMIKAAERQQLLYLPDGHSIQKLEYLEYDKKYNINQYQDKAKQVPFCLTILSRNNIQNDRYIKVLQSVLQQKYDNYHIIFADDLSTDDNLNASIKYLLQQNFPKDRMTFIQSKSRNFATYNIISAAFNYCKEDDIQMLLDGDDQLIGKYAFQVMNSVYQQNPQLWVVYSNYKANTYMYGRSLPIKSEEDHVRRGKRLPISKIGPIRTWRIKLLYNIPPTHHKMINEQWLDTVYDDALQHPLIELAGLNRVKYVSEILYEYNVAYGDNDDSTKEKRIHRTAAYIDIIKLKPLDRLQTLQNSIKNKQIENEFNRDKGKKYVAININQWKK